MLENVVAAERQAIADDRLRARQAAKAGDSGLATHLETIVEEETAHFEETEKILRGWQPRCVGPVLWGRARRRRVTGRGVRQRL